MAYRAPSPNMEKLIPADGELAPMLNTVPAKRPTPLDVASCEPTTPTTKPMLLRWHGLPTPGSPEFPNLDDEVGTSSDDEPLKFAINKGKGDRFVTPQTESYMPVASNATEQRSSSSSSGRLSAEYRSSEGPDASTSTSGNSSDDMLEDRQRDAKEILREEFLHSENRRSARLLHKDITKKSNRKHDVTFQEVTEPSMRVATKTASSALENPHKTFMNAPAETSLTKETMSMPTEVGPIAGSHEWQLQYPEGGSTHPSYPYPAPDPRLLFNPSVIPVADGLPDLSRLPKLKIPIGWTHVTWAGLLPVAFDPYHQAFKLTPVGPMPLTFEEVQQNGLCKFVPGGEYHPEAGLLPDVSQLGWGSIGDEYDLEGSNWVMLPLSNMKPGTKFLQTSLYNERRDCPDKVYDLEDGWRWLREKEEKPDEDFQPTRTKHWRGSGATWSTRKLKLPIAELIMDALMEDDSSIHTILCKQDSRADRGSNCFCPYKSVATPVSVNIALLADTEFTIMELLCYFPQHIHWTHAAQRLSRAGMTGSVIRNIVNMTRQLSGEASVNANSVTHQLSAARKRALDSASPQAHDGIVEQEHHLSGTGYSAEKWKNDVWELIDYPILALAHGVQKLPTGPDAGPLTALIKWCKDNARFTARLSEVPKLLNESAISPLIEPGANGCPDLEVIPRHEAEMKQDNKRVMNSLKFAGSESDEIGRPNKKRKRLP